ncbi:MAG: ATP-binding protein [Candidatus Cryptobacteroides sp.]
MTRTIIQLIKACASKLRNSKLQRLGGKEISENLDALMQRLQLGNRGEAIVFTAMFDRSCSGRPCDLDDLASYFDCAHLDVMEYLPAIKSLCSRGIITLWDTNECDVTSQRFCVPAPVKNCLLDNRLPSMDEMRRVKSKFDRYDLCKRVDAAIQDRQISTLALMQMVSDYEETNSGMTFVRKVRELVPELADRVLYYEICYDFYNKHKSDLDDTLEDMYESFGERFSERRKLVDGTSGLVKAGLLEFSDDYSEVTISDAGQQVLLEEDYDSYVGGIDCGNRYRFARMVRDFFHDSDKYDSEKENSLTTLAVALCRMEHRNPHLGCVRKTKDIITNVEDRALFYIVCSACPGGVNLTRELRYLFPINKSMQHLGEFKDEKHNLQVLDLVEMRNESSIFGEYSTLTLTDKGKELYFEEDAKLFIEKIDSKDIIKSSDIAVKQLFFAEDEQRQLSMVGSSLEQENYLSLVDRLSAKGLSKGIAVLLYGAPGTGKTESVMQWARATGRDVVHVDLSASKSMWYGESEKIVKGIFTRYRNQCKRSKLKPILLFNEADGLFSKRKDISRGSSVDQTENTIQNILLEEMEKLDGILVATTNLADNLDSAFERRFLFKIKLEKPSVEAKRRIWSSKLPALTEEESAILAESFDFSGGEIDNIVRKAVMEEVLSGKSPDIESVMCLCREEKMGGERLRRIGF